MNSSPEILFERRGAAGIVTLNRPQALNAVTLGMVRALALQLDAWAADDAVTRVILTAAGERAFSAGGDVRAIYDLGRAGRIEDALTYFREEYVLNTAIKRYRKPYVSLIDGIVMGGGAGLSVHGSHRVAGDRFRFAMPETAIGFFPDIGGTWFLSHMPGEAGTYCALTGARIDAADAVASTVATHRVASARFADLLDALCGDVPVDAILGAFAEPQEDESPEGPVMAARTAIDRLFAAGSVEDILAALDGADEKLARDAATAIRANAPTSLKVTLEQVRRGRNLSFEDCMRMEFRIVSRFVRGHEMYEGIRAAIVDKDRAPKWNPASLDAVSAADVERYFAPLEKELVLP